MISLTRRYRFSASHRLHVDSLSAAENDALFGKCNNPWGHGHDYLLSVTVTGEVEEATGLILPTAMLDALVEDKILRIFAHRNLNKDVPHFAGLVPTTENVAVLVADLLESNWTRWFGGGANARLTKIHVQETDRNGFEILLNQPQRKPSLVRGKETAAVHA